MQKEQIIEKVMTIAYSGALWTLGGLANMLYRHAKGEDFKFIHRVMNLWLSFIVSWMIGEFIPKEFQFRDWVLGVAGAVAMAIMNLIQIYGAKFVFKSTPLWSVLPEEEKK